MLCPHCGHNNVEGRKYCRACAKPLSAEPAAPKPLPPLAPSPPTPALPSSPATSKMAVASLVLSFLAFIVPLGVASVVMGHISRRQIGRSNGQQSGAWFAFAGLILSYLQLAVVAVLVFVLVGLVLDMNKKLGREPYVRAALVERLTQGDPRHPSAAAAAENRNHAIDTLRLIRDREDSYKQSRPEGYACDLLSLTNADPELRQHAIESHYQFQVVCQPDLHTGVVHGYSVSAVARFDAKPDDAPAYCLDSTEMIRKYSFGEAADGMANRTFLGREPCPDNGELIE